MNKSYKKLSAWIILVGLFLQVSTPVVAAIQSSNLDSSEIVLSGKSGAPIKVRSSELEELEIEKPELVDVANFNLHGLIGYIVEDAVEQGCEDALSPALKRCYKLISEGETVIDVKTLIEAMPELLQYAIAQEKMRAVRPSLANNTLVSCSGSCDLTQVIQLLSSIRTHIGTVEDSPCCNTILGILGDACNVPCIGENGSISEVLCEILNTITSVVVDLDGVFTVLADIKDTLTECCAQIQVEFNGVFTVLADIKTDIFDTQTLIIDGFEGTWTVLADIKDTLTECCAQIQVEFNGVFTVLADIKTDIFDTQTLIIEGFEGTWTMIEDCCACGPIPLFQSDVVGGVINLTTTGLNYCLAENITGNIFISGGNVTVDGSDRVLSGRVYINAADVIFKNTKVKPVAPGDSTEAGFAGIHATLSSTKLQVLNCLVECADTVFIADPAINGRTGIFSDADKTVIKDCKVIAGVGGGNFTGIGGDGGNGIEINGADGLIDNSTVAAGNGGNGGGFGAGTGGNGGNGIEINGADGSIHNSIVAAGLGGFGTIDGGDGGNGIEINNVYGLIDDSTVTAGAGGFGNGGIGGDGGNGIEINNVYGSIHTLKVTAGAGGGGVIGGGNGGNGIVTQANDVIVVDSQLFAGDGGGSPTNGGLAGACVSAQNAIRATLANLLMAGGNGGNGGTGNGGGAFACIDIFNMDTVIIKSCSIDGGGNGGNSTGGGNGGAGANGIHLRSSSSNVQIEECLINNIGLGGTGVVSGAHGNGIQIDSDSVCVQVVSNRVSCCPGIGINNDAGTESTFYNNIVTDCNPNYVNVPLIRVPGPHTGFFTNVTQGPQDCDLCDLFTVIQEDFEGTWTMIEDCCACGPIPLFQSDVDPLTNAILLTMSGMNYCLAENITGTISITGDNVTIEGNNRLVTGRVFINASEVIIKDTNVQAPGVADNSEMSFAGIHIAGGSDNQIVNCVVTCDAAPNSSLGVAGRKGIFSAGARTRIINSEAIGGNGGEATDQNIIAPNGGNGIEINAVDGLVNTSRGLGGVGGGALGGTGINTGGNGGIGILLNGNNGITKDSEGKGGNGGGAFSDPGGAAGAGGNGIRMTGIIGSIENSVGIGGNGGVGVTGGTVGGAGGIGIDINGDKYAVRSSKAIGGSGIQGFGGVSGGVGLKILGSNALINDATITGGDGGLGNGVTNGGGAGAGIQLPVGANFIDIFNSIVTGGNGGNAAATGNGGGAGSGMDINILNVRVADSEIRGGNGGNGGTGGSAAVGINVIGASSNVTINGSTLIGGNGGAGSIGVGGGNGHALITQGNDVIVADSKLFAGDGANGATNGGNAGACVTVQSASHVSLLNLSMVSGNGGNGGAGNGGNAVSCIDIFSMDTVIIKSCSIDGRGTGGAGSVNGGAGANGINIRGGSSNIQIEECVINNVGLGGTGAVSGANGNGIQIDSDSECVQVVSNRVACCPGIGINNDAGTESTFYNNIVTDCNPNYVNVPLIRVPGPHTGFFTNVTQGPQDCDLCDLFTVIQTDFEGTWTMIEDCCACGPIPLFQPDVDGDGEIKLTMTGLSYCLAENITGNIVISASDVTVSGEGHILTGRFIVNGPNAIVRATKIKPQAPVSNADANNAAVAIGANGDNVQILNCVIECAASAGATIGRRAIVSQGEKTIIKGCNVTAGSANLAIGGLAVQILGSNSSIEDSIIQSGDSVASFAGYAIEVGTNVILSIDNVTVISGNGAVAGFAAILANATGAFTSIRNSKIIGGANSIGIVISDGIIDNVTVLVGTANNNSTPIFGIYISSSNKCSVTNSKVVGGNNSAGNGGIGIRVEDSSRNIEIDTVEVQGGSGTAGGGQGIFVSADSSYVSIANSNVIAGNSTGNGLNGSNGIQMLGSNGSIDNVTSTGSNGAASSSGNGGNGGSGIFVQALNTTVRNSIVTGARGGNTSANPFVGGIGGKGIDIFAADTVIIKSCSIDGGSNGGNSTGGGNGGVGGNGINIRGGSSNVQIEECLINNIGLGGTGAISGANGNGIQIDSDSECVQVVSNRISCCPGIGINNDSGTESTFYNNIVTDCNPNYVNVPLIRVPGPHTGFFTNVTQGPQDCDLCDLFTVIQTDFEGTWTILADIKDTLTECCAQIQVEFNGVFTVLSTIEDDVACGPIPLFQSDVVGGVINLTTTGLNYCLAENIVGNIFISGGNVMVDGNDRVVTGRFEISALDVIVKNTKIKPLSPIDSVDVVNEAVLITGDGVTISNCLVECGNTTVSLNPAVNGRDAIRSTGDRTTIKDCNIKAGNGGTSAVETGAAGGNGGRGIILEANLIGLVENTSVIGGFGGNGGASTSVPAGDGGGGGDAILLRLDSTQLVIRNVIPTGGTGGTGGNAANSTGGDGGPGGTGIRVNSGTVIVIDSCVIQRSGIAGAFGTGSTSGGPGQGGIGIFILPGVQQVQIINCKLEQVGVSQDNVAAGGDGIRVDSLADPADRAANIQIINNKIVSIGAIGIHLNGVLGSGPDNCQIIGNILESFGRDGITVEAGSNEIQVASNRINNANLVGIRNDATAARFANNMVNGSGFANYSGAVTPPNIALASDPDQNIGYWANVF